MITNQKKKLLIILSVFFLFIITISVIYFTINKTKETNTLDNNSNTDIYIDPGSGETIYSSSNKSSEKSNETIFLGFSKLLNIGLTSTQVEKIKNYFTMYATLNNLNIKEVSIAIDSIKQTINKESGEKTLSFVTTINRDYKLDAKISYNGINNIILNLYNQNDVKQIFTSLIGGN